ncbi:MAG: phospholipase D-like domain-containing protein [Burkholderiaceae bacterium]|nr:phospholipase D-like domain-containing protein [Burkholderiaceae bacterium]
MNVSKALLADHRLELLQGSRGLFPALVVAMSQAREEILFETYIFDFHGDSLTVAEALAAAAERGVQVRVVLDGDDPISPFGLWFPTRWRRLHRKLCAVDRSVAFCGGVNLLDDHYDPHQRRRIEHPRLDFSVQVHGPLVQAIHDTMAQLWWRVQLSQQLRRSQVGEALETLREPETAPLPDTRGRYRLVLRDNLRHRRSIQKSYLQAIGRAKREILIANAFFLPGGKLRRALVRAAQRGVKVRLLLQGRYEYLVPYRAAYQVYGQLLSAGVEIVEYTPSYLHAKVAVIDSRWMTVGSSNLDPLSLLLAREANIVAQAPAVAGDLREALLRAMDEGGRVVNVSDYQRRSWFQRWLDWSAYSLMRIAIFLTARRY